MTTQDGLGRPYAGSLEAFEQLAARGSISHEGELQPDQTFGPYRIDGVIGSGGMGQVYAATALDDGTRVALKVARSTGPNHDVLRKRLENEAAVLRRLQERAHDPNIVDFIAAGEIDGIYFLATKLLDGDDLLTWAQRKRRSAHEVLAIGEQVASAIQTCHAHDVLHRDLTPSNVIVVDGERPVLLDFGIGRDDELPNTGLTGTGHVPGKYAYLPPEAARRAEPDPRWDLYAFGACLHAMWTGQEFDPHRTQELFPSLSASDDSYTRKLKLIARQCLAGQAQHRYQSADELRSALRRALHPSPPWRGHLLAGIAVVLIAALFALAQFASARRGASPNLFWSHVVHVGMLSLFSARAILVWRLERRRLELPRFMPGVWLSFLTYYVFNAWKDAQSASMPWHGIVDATISNLTGCFLLLAVCSLWLPTRGEQRSKQFSVARISIWFTWVSLLGLALLGTELPNASANTHALFVALPSSLFVGFALGLFALGLGQKSLQAPFLAVAMVLIYALLQVVYPAFAWIHAADERLLIVFYGLGMIGKLAIFLGVESTIRSWSLFGYEGQLSNEW